MVSPNSRKIGNRNERELAKAFKEWTGWDFHKTPASGGLHWARDHRVAADIVCPADKVDLFPFCVEAKRRKTRVSKKKKLVHPTIDIGDALTYCEDWKAIEFWEQVSEDADRIEKLPMLAMRNAGMDRGEFYIMITSKLGRKLYKEFDIPIVDIGFLGVAITTMNHLKDHNADSLFKWINDRKEEFR